MEPNNRGTVKELPFSVTSKFSSRILPYSLLAVGVFVHERNTIDRIDVKQGSQVERRARYRENAR